MSQTYRVYFNAHADFPYVWSIDTGDDTEELNVKSIELVPACDTSRSIETQYRTDRQPKAWFSVTGELTITDGHAQVWLA